MKIREIGITLHKISKLQELNIGENIEIFRTCATRGSPFVLNNHIQVAYVFDQYFGSFSKVEFTV